MKKFIILCLTISYAIGSSSEIIKTYNLKAPSFINNMSESFTKNLSTKNQQKWEKTSSIRYN